MSNMTEPVFGRGKERRSSEIWMLLSLVCSCLFLQTRRATRETSRSETIGMVAATAMLVWLAELEVGDEVAGEGVERARPRAHAAVTGESGPAELEIPAA
jgi:hypothetical protein